MVYLVCKEKGINVRRRLSGGYVIRGKEFLFYWK
jgi:hypothetical protein